VGLSSLLLVDFLHFRVTDSDCSGLLTEPASYCILLLSLGSAFPRFFIRFSLFHTLRRLFPFRSQNQVTARLIIIFPLRDYLTGIFSHHLFF
jgi:hypothetical protein